MSVVVFGTLLPFFGTVFGAASVLFMKCGFSGKTQKILSGFAGGVMAAASVWSLLIPAINMSRESEGGSLAFIPAVTGLLADVAAPENHSDDYVYAVLVDEDMLLDPLGALRITYPRLLGMRIRNSRTNDEAAAVENSDAENLSPIEHFQTFYALQNHETPPDERRLEVMRQIIQEAEEIRHAPDHP